MSTHNVNAFHKLSHVVRPPFPAPTTDFPLLRASGHCYLCDGRKLYGLVTCWTCYNDFDGRNGFTCSALSTLTSAEITQEQNEKETK